MGKAKIKFIPLIESVKGVVSDSHTIRQTKKGEHILAARPNRTAAATEEQELVKKKFALIQKTTQKLQSLLPKTVVNRANHQTWANWFASENKDKFIIDTDGNLFFDFANANYGNGKSLIFDVTGTATENTGVITVNVAWDTTEITQTPHTHRTAIVNLETGYFHEQATSAATKTVTFDVTPNKIAGKWVCVCWSETPKETSKAHVISVFDVV